MNEIKPIRNILITENKIDQETLKNAILLIKTLENQLEISNKDKIKIQKEKDLLVNTLNNNKLIQFKEYEDPKLAKIENGSYNENEIYFNKKNDTVYASPNETLFYSDCGEEQSNITSPIKPGIKNNKIQNLFINFKENDKYEDLKKSKLKVCKIYQENLEEFDNLILNLKTIAHIENNEFNFYHLLNKYDKLNVELKQKFDGLNIQIDSETQKDNLCIKFYDRLNKLEQELIIRNKEFIISLESKSENFNLEDRLKNEIAEIKIKLNLMNEELNNVIIIFNRIFFEVAIGKMEKDVKNIILFRENCIKSNLNLENQFQEIKADFTDSLKYGSEIGNKSLNENIEELNKVIIEKLENLKQEEDNKNGFVFENNRIKKEIEIIKDKMAIFNEQFKSFNSNDTTCDENLTHKRAKITTIEKNIESMKINNTKIIKENNDLNLSLSDYEKELTELTENFNQNSENNKNLIKLDELINHKSKELIKLEESNQFVLNEKSKIINKTINIKSDLKKLLKTLEENEEDALVLKTELEDKITKLKTIDEKILAQALSKKELMDQNIELDNEISKISITLKELEELIKMQNINIDIYNNKLDETNLDISNAESNLLKTKKEFSIVINEYDLLITSKKQLVLQLEQAGLKIQNNNNIIDSLIGKLNAKDNELSGLCKNSLNEIKKPSLKTTLKKYVVAIGNILKESEAIEKIINEENEMIEILRFLNDEKSERLKEHNIFKPNFSQSYKPNIDVSLIKKQNKEIKKNIMEFNKNIVFICTKLNLNEDLMNKFKNLLNKNDILIADNCCFTHQDINEVLNENKQLIEELFRSQVNHELIYKFYNLVYNKHFKNFKLDNDKNKKLALEIPSMLLTDYTTKITKNKLNFRNKKPDINYLEEIDSIIGNLECVFNENKIFRNKIEESQKIFKIDSKRRKMHVLPINNLENRLFQNIQLCKKKLESLKIEEYKLNIKIKDIEYINTLNCSIVKLENDIKKISDNRNLLIQIFIVIIIFLILK